MTPVRRMGFQNDPPKVTPMPDADRSDDLRTRIAAVLSNVDTHGDGDCYLDFADAVIRELGLRQEWQIPDDRGPGAVIRNDKPAGRSLTRYTTEWKPDDE